MKDSTEVKEIIISSTIELIEQSNGDIKKITSRSIAEKSGEIHGSDPFGVSPRLRYGRL